MNDVSTALTLTSNGPEDTAQWARALANLAAPGRVVCLWGDVGAGKTFLARSFIQTLQARHGAVEDVPSPTFTIVQTYPAGTLEIWHADLYRLSSSDEVYELGLIDAFQSAFCMIEWPDRLGDMLPADAIHIKLSHMDDPNQRSCMITCSDQQFLAKFAQHLEAHINV